MSGHVVFSRRGGCLEILLDRPAKKNALTVDMYQAMAEAMTAAEAEPDIRSVLFHGAGDAFCAGNDLFDFLSQPLDANSPVIAFLRAISHTSKVMISAVHGACVGIGATLLLHCDHVVASQSANLHFSFVRLALVPEAASSLLLPRTVGHLTAAELLLTGDPVSAGEAVSMRLVSKVVAEGQHLAAARAFADRLEILPPAALLATRRLLRGESRTVEGRIAEEIAVFGERLKSAEFKEAVTAFMEKRAPDFRTG